MASEENGDPPVPDLQTIEELCQPSLNGRDDDAKKHLDKFLHVTQRIKVNGIIDDTLRLYLFPHSLTHHATTWFDRLQRNSINTFEKMAKMFLGKYFPPSMVTKLRNEIINFRQRPDEWLFEVWERYKLSIDRCPNHNMLPITQIDTFYNGLTLRHRDTINAAVGETFMKRCPEECYDLIENMTAHHNDWDTLAQRSESLAFPLPVIQFPLAEEVPTASVEGCHCQKKSEATARKIALLSKVIKFGDSYVVPANTTDTTSGDKSGRTLTLTREDMQRKKNDTFGGNEATKKTKKNLLKQQYGNFKAEGSETLEQTFNRLQVIIGQLQFMDVKIKQDDLNQNLLTSLAPEWLIHTIVWRNRSDLDTMSLDDLYNHLKVYESEVQKKPEQNSQNMFPLLIDEDDIEEIDIKWNMALLSMRADKFWKKTDKKISIQRSDVAGFDKSKVECFNCHKMGHFARECRAPRSRDRGRRDNFRHGSKAKEQAPKVLMAIDGVGWDWSYMANDEEDHALVADEVAPTEFALMANTSAESKVFDNYLCSKDCKKNNDSLNSKITDLTDKLFDANNFIYHYKLALALVESRLVEYKEREVKYIEKIRTLEYYNESYKECNDLLKKKLETLQQEKEGVDGKLAGLLTALKDLDNIIESQRSEKNNEGLGYTVIPPPTAELYLSPNKDLSWTGLLECANDTVTDYSRPSPTVESILDDDQNRNPYEIIASPITSKPFIKFVKPKDSQSDSKTDKKETPKKPSVKTSAVRSPSRAPWVPTVNRKYSPVNRKFSTGTRNFPTSNRKFPIASRKFPTGSTKSITADMGLKEKAGSSLNKIDDKGYWDSGCSRHMTGNISYLSDYEPYDGRNVSFGQGGCKITGKGTIKMGKFEEKRDEGYFNGYSMSSKAFRVFIKITRRVEKNLHVEFLENKAIEKGASPNWLFDIDSLTKSMNYVPVDAGTIFTNLSGTKDATSQEVKKDVSSLRYTALPNWSHDALLKFSSSKPQDHCSTEVPEGNGNTNPIAYASNPPADHIETLTVESPILTVSSLVPTAYSTDSQEPSSDLRLILKRVANQEETPSLENILSLTNRFEDILGGTINSDESNGEEADMSNIETIIKASPTLTLRI
nr:hypothetical protein [Tanacetum cinerariifolium]